MKRGSDNTRLRIGMLGLYGMPLPQLHFTGFETAFGEIAPRLVRAGHEVTIYCRATSFPPELRVTEHEGVRLKYVPSPGGKNLSASLLRCSRRCTPSHSGGMTCFSSSTSGWATTLPCAGCWVRV